MTTTVGIAGLGALGSAVARALLNDNITGLELIAASETNPSGEFDLPLMSFEELTQQCDLIIECLPPQAVKELATLALDAGKDLIMITSSALLIHPEILDHHDPKKSRIIIPSGALAGIDGVSSLKHLGIKSASIATTKKPQGFGGAPYIVQNNIDLSTITEKQCLFKGNALEAAKGFPANVNVAATLSLAGIGAQHTDVEIWADPEIKGNTHTIKVQGEFSTITATVENTPDPNNPKSSMFAAQSIVATLRALSDPFVVL